MEEEFMGIKVMVQLLGIIKYTFAILVIHLMEVMQDTMIIIMNYHKILINKHNKPIDGILVNKIIVMY